LNKTIAFELNNFPTIPHELRTAPVANLAAPELVVDLARLYHHYYTDTWEVTPINPDHTNFEYLRFLHNSNDFRFLEARVSTSEANKRMISFKLGQAFCRYFLYEFCGITYFANMDKVLNKHLHPAFDGMKITRLCEGDVPDYLCAKSIAKPYIGEAKGRFSNISFTSAEFDDWRDQFTRIKVANKHGITKKLKGYIIGTKFTTEQNRPTNKSKVMAEDPETIGNENISDNELGLGSGCIAVHYSRLFSKLGLNLLAASLEEGFVVPQDLQYNLPVWECNYPPLKGEKFVGGFISNTDPNFHRLENGHAIFYPNILRLGIPSPSFFGIRASTFRTLRKVCLGQWSMLSEISELPDTEFRASNIAWLRDGSITGALDFFTFTGTEIF
jgi:hypothetical protein